MSPPSTTLSVGQTAFVPTSIRAKIREGCDGYNAFDYYWLRCLYEGETGDPKDVETGFLKNALLVKVRRPHYTLLTRSTSY